MQDSTRVCLLVTLLELALTYACFGPSLGTQEHRSITVLMWSGGAAAEANPRLLSNFTQKTGIAVHIIPASESASHRLGQTLAILQGAPGAVDVVELDTTWPPILANHLADLRSVLGDSIPDELPQVIENATIGGRLVGAPFLVEYGMLYYRTDLLRKYGFGHAPATWAQLEWQAATIQRGERAAGHPNFWGYVWQGAEYEGLTCNALEWQSSQGGGNLLQGHAVHVNNPATVKAFARAAAWIGKISPPGITAYLEEDSRNMWQSGDAAFLRNWSYVYPLARNSGTVGGRFSVVPIPADTAAPSSVIGGSYLGIAKGSKRYADAVQFVKFMTGRQAQEQRAIRGGYLATLGSVYRAPAVLQSSALFPVVPVIASHALRRPVSSAGAQYDRVSQVYAHGVHEILTGTATAAEECARMQGDLMRIAGLAGRTE